MATLSKNSMVVSSEIQIDLKINSLPQCGTIEGMVYTAN